MPGTMLRVAALVAAEYKAPLVTIEHRLRPRPALRPAPRLAQHSGLLVDPLQDLVDHHLTHDL